MSVEQKYSPYWEDVSTNDNGLTTKRMRIVGGWLVHVANTDGTYGQTVFCPDSSHDWQPSTQVDPD